MKRIVAALMLGAIAGPAVAGDAAHPVVVELFQSQGCSSCPPANASLNAIAGRPDVLALSFGVTYWDRLGWRDTFAQPAFTARQWDYARAGGRRNVATPQMIVDGTTVINGGNPREAAAVIGQASRGAAGPSIAAAPGRVTIGAARAVRPATVWLVRYDPRTTNVAIRAGENGGRTLPHRNIVRALAAIGTWGGAVARFAIPPSPDPAWRSAILIQQDRAGPIVAAARI